MNKVTLIGRLTGDPEIRYTKDELAIATFDVAISRGKDKGADFPRVQAFGKTAENIERHTGKGLRVAVEGRIRTGSYINRSGDKVYTTDVVADRVEFLDWKESKREEAPQGDFKWNDGYELTDDDLPY